MSRSSRIIRRRFAEVFAALLLAVAAPAARADIANTLHNLTPDGPGEVKNPDEVGLCRFCHTPHRAGQTTALWNRELSEAAYDIYESSTLEAAVEQPTGSSRLCLSCHDGTLALGNLLHAPGEEIAPLGPLQGRVRLGTDLSDDHPVSFVYDESLAAAAGELAPPHTLVGPVRLDRSGRVQCTSCHDPHQDRFPKFLVTETERGQLCLSCHVKDGWQASSHALSPAEWNGVGEDPWPGSRFSTVAENACLSCHDPHSSAQPVRLLVRDPQEEVCLACHTGNVARTDLRRQLDKFSHHPVVETSGVHDPAEDPLTMQRHVACTDCHDPHAVNAAEASAPDVSGRQQSMPGIDVAGLAVEPARFTYEVCYRCHGLFDQPAPRVTRLDPVSNVRLETHPGNPSFHPVTAPGTNPNVISLIPPLTPSSRIYCHDCHNTDDARAPAPRTALGPHGSDIEPIFEREYPLVDFVSESPAAYALCFKCHDREILLDDAPFLHDRHVDNQDVPCVACHDAHGSRANTHLINFLRFDATGREVVRPSLTTGRLEFLDLGTARGRCYLNCHGEEHAPRGYVGNDKED